ncbi:MAG: glycoside hydrolase, partial [Duncaniella sp.]|nr:glycoside hydrolase [Duncaniella sp.]
YYVFMIQGKDGQRQEIVWRSRNLTEGPWEGRLVFGGEMVDADGNEVMHTNGIAQGGVVQAGDGRWWCFLFKDYGSVGRMPMLFPMTWSEDGWPVVGENAAAAPYVCEMPVKGQKMSSIAESDEFNVWKPHKSRSRFGSHEPGLKLCWQWNHIPDNDAWSLTQRKGWLRLTANSTANNIRDARNTLTQRTFGPTCTGETLLDVSGMTDGSRAGLASFQNRYGWVGVKKDDGKYYLVMHRAMDKGDADGKEIACLPLNQTKVWLRVPHDFRDRTDKARFFYSLDGKKWLPIGDTLQMYYDWPDFCGQRYALFHYATAKPGGHADFDYFHIGE